MIFWKRQNYRDRKKKNISDLCVEEDEWGIVEYVS